jgi:uncharacterized membrane protein (UPF0127 family)
MWPTHQIKNNIYFVKMFLKVVLSIACYLFFTIYTVPMYENVRAYVDEKFSDRRAIVLGEAPIFVEIVQEGEDLKKGLSGRSTLQSDEGMLFIFEKADLHGIWMKDMNFAIDIIWLNEYGEVVHYEKNVVPETFPKVFAPSQLSKYVIEVSSGFIEREGIKIGDKIDLY